MTRPIKQMLFRPVQGIWQDVAGDSGTFSDFLTEYGIIIDDRTEFVRLKDYERNISIWLRMEAMKISVTIWVMSQD